MAAVAPRLVVLVVLPLAAVAVYPRLYRTTLSTQNFTDWANRIADHQPFASLPFTPNVHCEPTLSHLMDRFDWQVVPQSAYTSENGCGYTAGLKVVTPTPDPQTVWAAPNAAHKLLQLAETRQLPQREGRTVVFWGSEYPLSVAFGSTEDARNTTILELRKYFSKIMYQTKDIDTDQVRLAPMGLSWGYMLAYFSSWDFNHVGKHIATYIGHVHASLTSKTKLAMAAWGKVAAWLDNDPWLTELIPTLQAQHKLFPPSNSSLKAVILAHESRKRLGEFVNTSAAESEGIDFAGVLEPLQWYEELHKHKFLLSPLGSAILTAKNVEALFSLTIPIVERTDFTAYDELIQMGFPIVMVDKWEDVTRDNMDKWWAALSPRLKSFRSNCLSMDGFWKLFVGLVDRCE